VHLFPSYFAIQYEQGKQIERFTLRFLFSSAFTFTALTD
jgi:hypothetical protein